MHSHESITRKRERRVDTDTQREDEWSLLLTRLGRSHSEADFTTLYEYFAPIVKGFCQSSTALHLAEDAAEELFQNAMIKVWQNAEKYDASKSSAKTWVFTIVRNARIDYLRKHGRHNIEIGALDVDDIWDESSENQGFTYIQQVRNTHSIQTEITKLPSEQARCIKKVYEEGKSHADISKELGLPLGTVKSRIRLGLKRLQDALQR